MVMPFCSNGVSDMFEPEEWDFDKFSKFCWEKFKVVPQPYLMEEIYGGKRILASSNIIFA